MKLKGYALTAVMSIANLEDVGAVLTDFPAISAFKPNDKSFQIEGPLTGESAKPECNSAIGELLSEI